MTIEQIQQNITNNSDLRQVVNQLADYIQANPSSPGGAASYLVYTALLTQTGTSAPTAVVLENTLGRAVEWFYSSAGSYYCQLANPQSGDFPFDKTWMVIKQEQLSQISLNNAVDYIQLVTDTDPGEVSTNGFLAGTPIEIRIYP